ncbi:PaaX family transcriptional regulator [Luedemannella helvata]|uniref:PaaX family transcriptional regulator n=1 Tax=Luedemannella helvata TaxID=349315 RepID=UPI0031D28890
MPDQDQPQRRPQALMLAFLGEYVLGRRVCVSSGSVIDVLGRAGVSEHATRSTLTRMVGHELLRRQPLGRRMYFGLTERSIRILEEGAERIWQTGAVNQDWDGTWTLLGFSLPGSWQRERHDLRSQLGWAGFGPLQGGLWIAPGAPEVSGIVAGLGLTTQVRVFRATADQVTDVDRLVRDTWDLAGLAVRYEDFLERWDGSPPADPLAAKLGLVTDWLQIIRRDPRLPVRHLPPDWPAVRAQDLFHRLARGLNAGARTVAEKVLDTIPDE